MKKILTILIATLLIGTTAFAQESEITVEKGQYLEVGSAEENVTVDIYNELDTNLIWENVEVTNVDGVQKVLIPLNNPLKTINVHVVKGDEESVLKVNLTEPHEHQPHLVEFIRPTETEAGRMEYFVCDCGKAFEDKACTKEIENPEEWAYLAPVPKEEWGEGNPVPYIEKYDGKNITDPEKPNPTWAVEDVETYYENEEIEVQTELEERKADKSTNTSTNQLNTSTNMTTNQLDTATERPVVFAAVPEEEPTLWEQIKMFFINLFK